jgi:hypothetical protein
MILCCDNFNDGKCELYNEILGTGEEMPSGLDEETGICNVGRVTYPKWILKGSGDCDKLDLEGRDDGRANRHTKSKGG